MNNWNKLLFKVTGYAMLDPQRFQDIHEKCSRLMHERDEARDACRTQFKANQDYLGKLAQSTGVMAHNEWPLVATKELHQTAALAWRVSPILNRYHFPIEPTGTGSFAYVHPISLYPAEARLEFGRLGLL